MIYCTLKREDRERTQIIGKPQICWFFFFFQVVCNQSYKGKIKRYFMALESVVFQQTDPFSYGPSIYDVGFQQEKEKVCCTWGSPSSSSSSSLMVHQPLKEWDSNSSSPDNGFGATGGFSTTEPPPAGATPCRRKRRRTKTVKNREEIENQRMIHIAVERNRRRQMNDYLAVLRSMMPTSYVQRVPFFFETFIFMYQYLLLIDSRKSDLKIIQ